MHGLTTEVVEAASPRVVFIGASASLSHVNRHFEAWARMVGLRANLVAMDLQPDRQPCEYEEIIRNLHSSREVVGGVITNHKVALYQAFQQRRWQVTAAAASLEVVSCFRVVADGFEGDAEEPRAIERAVREIARSALSDPFSELVVFGGGGAGRAIAYTASLMPAELGLKRITITDTRMSRIKDVCRLSREWDADVTVTLAAERGVNDAVLARARPRSLVVNATGLGKDLGGSPLSPSCTFPERSIAWDLNYRGDLEFLRQARRQTSARGVRPMDGFTLFVAGWMEALSYIARIAPGDHLFQKLRAVVP